jgi:2-polyprenyl-3-methyl-5-hydroxy-6-metoxy-1,4-benzoquinol methylase
VLSMFEEELVSIEDSLRSSSHPDIPELFRKIPLEEFGRLLLDIPDKYLRMKTWFPSMASDEVQDLWTGSHGENLLQQSAAFVRSMIAGYTDISRKAIRDACILDFGCGWGRIIRLLYKIVPVDSIYAVDSWDQSIEVCRQHRVRGHLALSDWVPRSLPFERKFNLIFAFSVFSHLSEKTCSVALSTLRRYIAQDGVLLITMRPKEYWQYHDGGVLAASMIKTHDETGFAFTPHGRPPIDGDIPFGDTSMSLAYIEANFRQWRILSVEWNKIDPLQILVFLGPAST